MQSRNISGFLNVLITVVIMHPLIGHISLFNSETIAHEKNQYLDDICARFCSAAYLKNRYCIEALSISGSFASSVIGHHELCFSGEVYNIEELASYINVIPINNCDHARLILELILKKGIAAIERVNGQFLIVYYNKQEKKVFIINDHLGISQLFYYTHKDFLLFGSALNFLLAHPRCPKEIEWETSLKRPTPDQVLFNNRSYKTWFRNIQLLPPASIFTVNLSTTDYKIESYWKERTRRSHDNDPDSRTLVSVTEEYIALLEDAVRLRAAGNEKCYALLSGGLDSSVIAALASKHKPVETFSIITQLTWAEGTTTTCNNLSGDLQIRNSQFLIPVHELFFNYELAKKRIWRTESPVNHTDAFTKTLLHYAIKKVKPEVSCLLTGTGSDQLNGGLARWIVDDTELKEDKWEAFYRAIKDVENQKLVLREDEALWNRRNYINRNYLAQLSGNKVEENAWMFYVESALHTQAYSLVWDEVRASAYHGHKTRFPFLDFRFLPFIASIPPRLQKDLFFDKAILRNGARNLLPDYVIEKPKIAKINPDCDLHFKLFNFLTGEEPAKIVEDSLGPMDQPHPVINKQELVRGIKRLQQQPRLSEWFDVMHIINLGFLAQLPFKTESDMDIESSMIEVLEVLFDEEGKTTVLLAERLSLKKEQIDLKKPLLFADDACLLQDLVNDKYFLSRDNVLLYELEEPPWIWFLKAIDNQKNSEEILNELAILYTTIEEYLHTAIKEKILIT